MERITNANIKEKKMKKRKMKRKKIIITILILAIIAILIFVANKFLPIADVSKDNIKVSISTFKTTGKDVTATITSTTNNDIYYYIDYIDEESESFEESDYYEESLNNDNSNTNTTSNTTNDTSNIDTNNEISNNSINTSKSPTPIIKNISDSEYIKMNSDTLNITNNGTVYLKYGKFGKLSNTPYTFEITNIDKTGPEIGEIETNSTSSTITITVTAVDLLSDNLTYYFKLQDSKDYICTGTKNTYTFTELDENTDYIIFIKVEDEFGNSSEAVYDTNSTEELQSAEIKPYYIKVNLATNIVVVYDKNEDGKFEKPVKEFICSTGISTPKSGKYKISYKYRWLALFGNVYGQYAVRIHGNILFHSVPYTDMYPDTLEYEEYDKLGTSASAGCIRLTVKDAKWIYDNVASGSYVEFYSNSSDYGPFSKPKAKKISSNKQNRNWDPTDPDQRNPWNGGTGVVAKTEKPKANTSNSNSTNTNTSNSTIIWNTID